MRWEPNMEKAKVSGHEGLVKDLHSNAIINDDRKAFLKAKEAKEKRLKELQRMESLEEKVHKLENLLEKLLEGKL